MIQILKAFWQLTIDNGWLSVALFTIGALFMAIIAIVIILITIVRSMNEERATP